MAAALRGSDARFLTEPTTLDMRFKTLVDGTTVNM
jgi:hypothetical protein